MTTTHNKVYVAMSGGVDSSVAALLLKRYGYDVVGVYMKNWSEVLSNEIMTDACSWEEEYALVQENAKTIGIPCRSVNFEHAYREHVIERFINGYRTGVTPNPDVECNRVIKFGTFIEWATKNGADLIATGHHVRKRSNGTASLLRGLDTEKDQSYFLYTLTQDALQRCLFPIGEFTKSEVRNIASEAQLPSASRKDSQGICFVGQVRLARFLEQFIEKRKGSITNMQGKVIGEHEGAWRYTIGQRHGLRVGGADGPFYVSHVDVEKNVVRVTNDERDLLASVVRLERVTWVAGVQEAQRCRTAKPRYRSADSPVAVQQEQGDWIARFTEPQRALSPGQSVVFYDGEELIGGGIIERVLDEKNAV